jgi:nitronate monooxygenase
MSNAFSRAERFCKSFGLRVPILLAPMAGASHPDLSIAVANAGGLGACGVLLMQPEEIKAWVETFRAHSSGPFQLNTWIPDPPPPRDPEHERRLCEYLNTWGPAVPPDALDMQSPDFVQQCEVMLELQPLIISSIMGLYPEPFIEQMKARGIKWFATVSTVAEARAAEAADADVVVAQGAEAGGHRVRRASTWCSSSKGRLDKITRSCMELVRPHGGVSE